MSWHWWVALCLLQVWQCGGSVEVLPCSRIAHIERAHKPYTEDLTAHVRRNALRVAEVWMDEFKSHVYMAWNIPQEVRNSHGSGFLGGWWGKINKQKTNMGLILFPWVNQSLVLEWTLSTKIYYMLKKGGWRWGVMLWLLPTPIPG